MMTGLLVLTMLAANLNATAEEDRLWQEIGVGTWSEVEDSDVDLPPVRRLLELAR